MMRQSALKVASSTQLLFWAKRCAPVSQKLIRFSSMSATPRKERQLCLSNRDTQKLIKRDVEVPVGKEYWDYVADPQSVQDAKLYANNTENYIGTVKYPVGIVGPLRVNGEHANKEYYVPMATHEGALLASYDRGAKAITEAGGVTVRIKYRCMLRAPVFLFASISDAHDFFKFAELPETKAALNKAIYEKINNCIITSLRVLQTDRKVHISLGINSDNAAGQNKVTYAGDIVMRYMHENYPSKAKIRQTFIEGGFNSGKRISFIHSLLGKGHSMVADVIIPKEVVKKVLHTTPNELQRFQKLHNRTNEFIGGISCTAHAANGLAAFYIANGQDPACVAESQAGVTHFDMEGEDLYASMTLNAVIVASVGGGTGLPSFKAARSMMGVTTANEMAEICIAVTLAGELSFYSAMASGEFSSAHWNMTHKS